MKIKHTLVAQIAAFAVVAGELCLRAAPFDAASVADFQKNCANDKIENYYGN